MTEPSARSAGESEAEERQARERQERASAPTHRDHCAVAGRFTPVRSRKRSCGSFPDANGLTFMAALSTTVCRQRRQASAASGRDSAAEGERRCQRHETIQWIVERRERADIHGSPEYSCLSPKATGERAQILMCIMQDEM